MKLKWMGAGVVFAFAGIIVLWRTVHPNQSASPSLAASSAARVVLFADMSEAGEEGCGCGKIILLVRETARRGVPTREVDSRSPGDLTKSYRFLVDPTVLVLDPSGHEFRRFEGESAETIQAIQTELQRLTERK